MVDEVPDDWRVRRLGKVADVFLSSVDKKSKPDEIPVRLCNYTDVYNNPEIASALHFMEATATTAEIERFALTVGDVVITKDSEDPSDIAVPALVAEDLNHEVICGYHLALLRPTEIDGEYLAWALRSRSVNKQFERRANGTTRFGLTLKVIRSSAIPVPPLPQQKKIAAILSSVDDAIAATRKVIEQTKRAKKGLLQTLMTRGIGHTRFKKTELGEIPEEWEVVRLGDLADVIVSNVNKKSDDAEISVRLCNYMDVYSHTVIREDFPFMEATATENEISKFSLRPGDVIITKDSEDPADIAVPALVPSDFSADVVCGYHLAILRPSGISSAYLAWALRSRILRNQFERRATGTTRFGLRIGTMRNTLVPLPPDHEQARIADILDSTHSVVMANQKVGGLDEELVQLRRLKSGLMHDLLTARVRVQPD